MRIVKVDVGAPAYESNIPNTLEAIQNAVGGYFEIVYCGDGICLCCNEEGKINGMKPNRFIGQDVIFGDFFLVGDGGDDFRDLTDEEIATLLEHFANCEYFSPALERYLRKQM